MEKRIVADRDCNRSISGISLSVAIGGTIYNSRCDIRAVLSIFAEAL